MLAIISIDSIVLLWCFYKDQCFTALLYILCTGLGIMYRSRYYLIIFPPEIIRKGKIDIIIRDYNIIIFLKTYLNVRHDLCRVVYLMVVVRIGFNNHPWYQPLQSLRDFLIKCVESSEIVVPGYFSHSILK